MGRVSRVNEWVETGTVSTGWHSVAVMGCLVSGWLGNLGLSSWNWHSLRLNSLRLNSLRLSTLRLNSLRLRGRTAGKLSSIGVVLEVQMCWVSRVNEWIEISSLLSWLGRSKLSLNRSLLELLTPDRCWLCTRSGGSTRCLTNWSRLRLKLSGC